MSYQGRGVLTERVAAVAKQKLGREITQIELRLMPYIQFQMMNEQKLDPRRINQAEREILAVWRVSGFIEGGASGLSITKDFWDAINEILFLAYVDIGEVTP